MSENIILTVIELATSLIVEGIILSMIFNWIASKETQNKLIFEQLQQEIRQAKTELINQVKESSPKGGKSHG